MESEESKFLIIVDGFPSLKAKHSLNVDSNKIGKLNQMKIFEKIAILIDVSNDTFNLSTYWALLTTAYSWTWPVRRAVDLDLGPMD